MYDIRVTSFVFLSMNNVTASDPNLTGGVVRAGFASDFNFCTSPLFSN